MKEIAAVLEKEKDFKEPVINDRELMIEDLCFSSNKKNSKAISYAIECIDKLDKIEQIVNKWNNDASHSFEDMCKINGILKG